MGNDGITMAQEYVASMHIKIETFVILESNMLFENLEVANRSIYQSQNMKHHNAT